MDVTSAGGEAPAQTTNGNGKVPAYGRRETDLPAPEELWPRWLWRLWWADVFFGHGRALEAFLIFVKLQYAALWLFIPVQPFVLAFQDIPAPRELFAIPFATAALTSLAGMILNAKGFECSKWFRIGGATVGMGVWIFILSKNMLIGLYGAGVNPWMVGGIVASLWIIRRGVLGLPRPGAPGAA